MTDHVSLAQYIRGKPRNIEANLCGSLYSTLKTSNGYKRFSKTITDLRQRVPLSIFLDGFYASPACECGADHITSNYFHLYLLFQIAGITQTVAKSGLQPVSVIGTLTS